MRLIDADALIDYFFAKDAICKSYANIDIKGVIDEQPEAIVRCENCIYWDTQDRSTVGIAKCSYQSVARYLVYTDADDFCSRGERKTDEKPI